MHQSSAQRTRGIVRYCWDCHAITLREGAGVLKKKTRGNLLKYNGSPIRTRT